MDSLWEILVIITVVVLAGLALLVGYLRGGGKKSAPEVAPPPPAREAKTRTANTYKAGSTATIDTSKGAPPKPPVKPAPKRPEAGAPGGSAGTGTTATGASTPTAEPTTEAAEPTTARQAQQPQPAAPAPDAPADATDLVEPAPAEAEPEVERPASARGRMTRLRSRLASSNTALGKGLLTALSGDKLDDTVWEEVEDTLLGADLGVEATTEIVDGLKRRVQVEGAPSTETLEGWLHEELLAQVGPDMDRRIAGTRVGDRPAVIMVVGVNGTGKTTTIGKLARVLVAEDKDIILGAADTFRAAAADQLETWGARVGVPTVRSDKEGADPAAVAFDAVKAGRDNEVDVVLIDTAGRLHNKVGLMDELAKVKRVIEKQSPIDECLLVLDATTGQNGMRQAEVFAQAAQITGVVLTKLDGTAKGGIVVLVQRELGVPVKLVGLGEGADDLAPFDPEAFVDAVLD
ncbi:MAG TPA: signal recognition particle-docking protein FtsY [Flexivirga sp.]|uniref:signal recognition particle-docking protein FtsY n=1 Tax=Flexivirga sp. TaxID=1962927 RepID=UPI002BEE107B|nr:signal recognition particle-docking protein FtsY [Flexivirga sp.]HWC22600.1 signal recognition particle-docking protein FtsY [Flexivirga sp.]